MTREELTNLITKKKEHGQLSKDDYYEIGVAHRKLLKADRSWSWLLSLTGGFVSAEAYRNFVLNRLKKNKVNFEEMKEENQKDEIYQLQKERMKLRDERTSLNAKLRDEARVERFLDELKSEANKLNEKMPIYCAKYSGKSNKTKTEAVALLSDIHLGMEIDELCNKYNIEIATRRLDKWTDSVISYCKSNNVRRLNVINLGDWIAGEIHPSIRIDQEEDVASQVIHAGELLAKALNKLQDAAPEVVYRSVSDNHARFVADKHQSIERENFFRLIDNWLEVRLENTKIKMPKDNVNFRTGKFYLMNGKLCMFEHGHCLKPNQSFQSLVGLVEEYVHYVFLGHYHEEKAKMYQNMKVFVNGSVCGTDLYADSIHKYTKPMQTLIIFDNDNVINISIGLDIR